MPRPLLSEALRVSAVLLDERGHAFMADEHPLADLARDASPCDHWRLVAAGADHLWLDATGIPDFSTGSRPSGEPARDRPRSDEGLPPIAPAAHYVSGGVCGPRRRDGLPGLWTCGETACSGVHGEPVASNSLLDGLVFGSRQWMRSWKTEAEETGVMGCWRSPATTVLGARALPAAARAVTQVRAELSAS
jgi:aspartate oxidase